MDKRICFIGHSKAYCDYNKLKKVVENEIINGCNFFTMGTHGDFDRLALAVCKNLRKKYCNIKIEVVLTSLNQIKKIVYKDEFGKDEYFPFNDVKTTIYEIENVFYKRKIIESNYKMIDNCKTLICFVNKNQSYGGAIKAYKYAIKKGLKIINLF